MTKYAEWDREGIDWMNPFLGTPPQPRNYSKNAIPTRVLQAMLQHPATHHPSPGGMTRMTRTDVLPGFKHPASGMNFRRFSHKINQI